MNHLLDSVNRAAQDRAEKGKSGSIPSYTLCPTATVTEIIEEMRLAVRYLWRRHGVPMVAAGHSAGGHLAACLVATDWRLDDLPRNLLPAGLAISGIFDLAPLIATKLNAALRLDAVAAAHDSPIHWSVLPGRRIEAWVGDEESGEFHRQSRDLAATWSAAGVEARYRSLPGANHFTVIAPLADPDSAMTQSLVAMARAAA